jgi:SAM-dependent methyltransferase
MAKARSPKLEAAPCPTEGWEGWDDYAPFYDWENARTLDRRDVRFWRQMARRAGGPVLELGCGTGRVTIPVARAGVRITGVDRSAQMLRHAIKRARRAHPSGHVSWVRGDIRELPFRKAAGFSLVMAPYGILQSLVSDRDLEATLKSVVRVLAPGSVFAMDLVPDLPAWEEYRNKLRFRGSRKGGRSQITLIEGVRQNRTKGLTIFDQQYVERRGTETAVRRFSLVFRTITVPQMATRLERAGFRIRAILGDYDGRPWDSRADVWLLIAEKKAAAGRS